MVSDCIYVKVSGPQRLDDEKDVFLIGVNFQMYWRFNITVVVLRFVWFVRTCFDLKMMLSLGVDGD